MESSTTLLFDSSMGWWYWFGLWFGLILSLVLIWWSFLETYRIGKRNGHMLQLMTWPFVSLFGVVLQIPAVIVNFSALKTNISLATAFAVLGLFGTIFVGIAMIAYFSKSISTGNTLIGRTRHEGSMTSTDTRARAAQTPGTGSNAGLVIPLGGDRRGSGSGEWQRQRHPTPLPTQPAPYAPPATGVVTPIVGKYQAPGVRSPQAPQTPVNNQTTHGATTARSAGSPAGSTVIVGGAAATIFEDTPATVLDATAMSERPGATFVSEGNTLVDDGRTYADADRTFADSGNTLTDEGHTLIDEEQTFADTGHTFVDEDKTLLEDSASPTVMDDGATRTSISAATIMDDPGATITDEPITAGATIIDEPTAVAGATLIDEPTVVSKATLIDEPAAPSNATLIEEPDTGATLIDEPEPEPGPAISGATLMDEPDASHTIDEETGGVQAQLVLLSEHNRRITLRSHGATFIVGRDSAQCTLAVSDTKVSRHHFSIDYIDDNSSWILTDLHSSNGTFVNGLRIRSTAVLQDNDRIDFGRNSARFTIKVLPADPE